MISHAKTISSGLLQHKKIFLNERVDLDAELIRSVSERKWCVTVEDNMKHPINLHEHVRVAADTNAFDLFPLDTLMALRDQPFFLPAV